MLLYSKYVKKKSINVDILFNVVLSKNNNSSIIDLNTAITLNTKT